jgi:hypothetical protein
MHGGWVEPFLVLLAVLQQVLFLSHLLVRMSATAHGPIVVALRTFLSRLCIHGSLFQCLHNWWCSLLAATAWMQLEIILCAPEALQVGSCLPTVCFSCSQNLSVHHCTVL